jgi:hypothetical protein
MKPSGCVASLGSIECNRDISHYGYSQIGISSVG